MPAPLGTVGTFFAAFAAEGPVPEVPEGLPAELAEVLDGLVASLAASER